MNCIITGGTKGIGRATAEIFARNNFNLAIAARTTADLEALQTEFQQRYPNIKILIFQADLSQKHEVLAFADFIKTNWKTIDVLINNAGLFMQGSLLTEPDDQLELMMNVNLFSSYHLTRALVPAMLSQKKGHIFNICSVASQQSYPNSGSYTITKFALLGFTKSLRLELQDQGIKVTAVLPGATLTDSWAGVTLPPNRLIHPQEVAKAIWSAWDMGLTAVIEEIMIRPQLGDL